VNGFEWQILDNQVKGLRRDGTRGIDWYFDSGSQLKYYPKIAEAYWI